MSAAMAAAWTALALALLPFVLTAVNLLLLRAPPRAPPDPIEPGSSGIRERLTQAARPVSVLLPARDEEHNIAAAIESVLANRHAGLELLVLDDGSRDATREIVERYARRDERVRLISGAHFDPSLWGKPQACAALAAQARGDVLLFMDADVRLRADAVERIAAELERCGAGMLSGVPRQITRGIAEKLVVPLIHFVLLGFLPLAGMRICRWRAFGVACGQLMAVDRAAYAAAGGHLAVASKVHDGMALARALRGAGFMTELADFGPIASCRMYRSAPGVIAGFAKNAHEGLGSPAAIVPWTIVLLGGQSAWLVALPLLAGAGHPAVVPLTLAAVASMSTRLMLALRFGHSWQGTLLHPVGVAVLVLIQWYALARRAAGRPVTWKARAASYDASRGGRVRA